MQSNPQVPWTEEQWARVNQAIQEEAQRARVAARFSAAVRALVAGYRFRAKGGHPLFPSAGLTINDRTIIELATLQVKPRLRRRAARRPRNEQRSVPIPPRGQLIARWKTR